MCCWFALQSHVCSGFGSRGPRVVDGVGLVLRLWKAIKGFML